MRQTAADSGALFLLDGLDEAREAATRERVLEAVTEFAAGKVTRIAPNGTSTPFAGGGQISETITSAYRTGTATTDGTAGLRHEQHGSF